jgi:metallo-beta-lactamase family protein
MASENQLTLSFYGGVGSVTGANFLIADGETRMLVDCGLIQGGKRVEALNAKPFLYKPAEINFLLVTHAHIDHIGRIGKLVRDGFRGTIYSTGATKDLARPMLEDAIRVMSSRDHKDTEPLYEMADVELAFSLWKTVEYHEMQEVGTFQVTAKDAGHILGSAIMEVVHVPTGKKVVFTGDLGNSPTPLLRDTEFVTDADYLVIESVYGNRVHKDREFRKQQLAEVVKRVIGRGGVLIIPVFSLEKTQVLLKELNDLIEDGVVPSVPVFFDSPLGIRLTEVYGRYTHLFNEKVQAEIKAGDDVFDFPKLQLTLRKQDSEVIGRVDGPKIIVASSGMSEGGRVTAHEKRYLPNKQNALLLIGYQIAGSVGRQLQEGVKQVEIDGTDVPVHAEVLSVSGYSSHKDGEGLLDFVSHTAEKVKKVFVVMGEPKASLFFVQKIRDNLGVNAEMPDEGETVVL